MIVEERDQFGGLSFFLSFDWMRCCTNGLGTCFTTFRSQSSGGRVSPCAASAGRSWDLFLVCLLVLSLYAEMQPRRSAARQGIL